VLLAALAGMAPAGAQVSVAAVYLERMDTDRNGTVSLAEYQQWMGYAFARMDRNGDGVLATDELPGGRGTPVTREAHLRSLAEAFARQDGNHDGRLDLKELAAPPR